MPHVDEKILIDGIKESITNMKSLVEEYTDAIPKDVSWKLNVDEETINKYEPQLEFIRQKIEDEETEYF